MTTKLKLYLGCNGNADRDGFTYCVSCSNLLVSIPTIDEIERDKVLDFLDRGANIFSGPIEDNNKAFNVINILFRDFGLFDKDKILKIQKFFQIHKECGIYLVLLPEAK